MPCALRLAAQSFTASKAGLREEVGTPVAVAVRSLHDAVHPAADGRRPAIRIADAHRELVRGSLSLTDEHEQPTLYSVYESYDPHVCSAVCNSSVEALRQCMEGEQAGAELTGKMLLCDNSACLIAFTPSSGYRQPCADRCILTRMRVSEVLTWHQYLFNKEDQVLN